MDVKTQYGLREPRAHKYVQKNAPAISPLHKDFLIGIEVEVERVPEPLAVDGWTFCEDGSLRNNGVEYVSKPLRSHYTYTAMQNLAENLPSSCEFSSRTSVHVHVNACNYTFEQIKAIMAVYCLYEKSLFNWVGKNRISNIYCQPAHRLLVAHYAFRRPIPTWGKYSAMNLNSLSDKGTIEFRHMYGNCDPLLITTWVDLITRLIAYAVSKPYEQILDEVCQLSTTSQWFSYTYTIFDDISKNLTTQETFAQDCQDGVRFVRSATMCVTAHTCEEFMKSQYFINRVPKSRMSINPDFVKDYKVPIKKVPFGNSNSFLEDWVVNHTVQAAQAASPALTPGVITTGVSIQHNPPSWQDDIAEIGATLGAPQPPSNPDQGAF